MADVSDAKLEARIATALMALTIVPPDEVPSWIQRQPDEGYMRNDHRPVPTTTAAEVLHRVSGRTGGYDVSDNAIVASFERGREDFGIHVIRTGQDEYVIHEWNDYDQD